MTIPPVDDRKKKGLGVPPRKRSGSRAARVPSPRKATASRRSASSRSTAQGRPIDRFTISWKPIHLKGKAAKQAAQLQEWTWMPPGERFARIEARMTAMEALISSNIKANKFDKLIDRVIEIAVEQGTYERSPQANIQQIIDDLNALRNVALGARSGAKQSPRHRGTERKRAAKGIGRAK